MEKESPIGTSGKKSGHKTAHSTGRAEKQEPAKARKTVKVLRDMDAAIAAFDASDEEGPTEFIVQKVISLDVPPIPTDGEIQAQLLKNALLLIDGGEFPLARNVLGDILRRNNNSVDAIRWMGWCFKQEDDSENALKCYEQLAQLRVTDQDLFELGELYYAVKKDKEALATWLDALGQCDAESPRLFDLHKNLGNVYMRIGDYESAEENYNKALVLRPQSDVLHVNIGSLNFQKKNFKGAMESFKRSIEINPYNDRGWCGVALVAREMKDDDWARGVLMRSLDINPYNQTALLVLTHWSQLDCRWAEAIQRVQAYVDKFQEDADMIYTLAGLHFQNGTYDHAEIELTRLEALEPLRSDIPELRDLIQAKVAGTQTAIETA